MKNWHILCVMVMTLNGLSYGMNRWGYVDLSGPGNAQQDGQLSASNHPAQLLGAIAYTGKNLDGIKILMIHSVERIPDDKTLESSLINLAEKNPGSPVVARLDWLRKHPVNGEWPLQTIKAQRGEGYHILVGNVNVEEALSKVRRLRLSAAGRLWYDQRFF